MSSNVLFIIVGVLIGMVIMGLLVWFTMPSLILVKHKSKLPYDQALTALNDNLQKKQGWRLVKINDYQESTASIAAIEKICSVNVCNPGYASNILGDDANRGVTAFMPLAIGVYEDKKGDVYISQLNVGLLGMMFGGTIARVMGKAGKDIKEVVGEMVVS
jgi:uncharacterized protein (DUF302 family)